MKLTNLFNKELFALVEKQLNKFFAQNAVKYNQIRGVEEKRGSVLR